MNKMDDGRRKLIREMYVACGYNASLAARRLGYSTALASYWHKIELFDDIPKPCRHCGTPVDVRHHNIRYCKECHGKQDSADD